MIDDQTQQIISRQAALEPWKASFNQITGEWDIWTLPDRFNPPARYVCSTPHQGIATQITDSHNQSLTEPRHPGTRVDL